MGYWNATSDGGSLVAHDTELVWGDSPADAMDAGIDRIVDCFVSDVGRKPTKAELRAGLEFALGSYEEHAVPDDTNRGMLPEGTVLPDGATITAVFLTAYEVHQPGSPVEVRSFDQVHGRPAPATPLAFG